MPFRCLRLGTVFCLLLGESSDYAQPITGQVTKVTCPVIGRAQPVFTPSKGQKTGPDVYFQKPPLTKINDEILNWGVDTQQSLAISYWNQMLFWPEIVSGMEILKMWLDMFTQNGCFVLVILCLPELSRVLGIDFGFVLLPKYRFVVIYFCVATEETGCNSR